MKVQLHMISNVFEIESFGAKMKKSEGKLVVSLGCRDAVWQSNCITHRTPTKWREKMWEHHVDFQLPCLIPDTQDAQDAQMMSWSQSSGHSNFLGWEN